MNNRRSLSDRMQAIADDQHVPHTDVDTIVTSARTRTRRTQRVAGLAAVLAIGGVSAVGIQQLSRIDDGAESLVPPVANSDQVPGAVSATTAPDQMPGPVGDPAVRVESNMTWNVIDAASPESVGANLQRAGSLGIATMPGVAADQAVSPDQPASYELFRQGDDGAWAPIASGVEAPVGNGHVQVGTDALYAIGTMPGVADGEPQPLAVATYDVTQAAWSQLELPVESDSRSGMVATSTNSAVLPYDTGAVALVSSEPYVQFDQLDESVQRRIDWNRFEGERDVGGMWVFDQDNCVEVVPTTISEAPAVTNPDAVATTTPFTTASPSDDCTSTLITWAELGLSEADSATLNAGPTTRAWRIEAGATTEIDAPSSGSFYTTIGGSVVVFQSDGAAWRSFAVNSTGAFEEVLGGAGQVNFAAAGFGRIAGVVNEASVATQEGSGAPTVVTDIRNLAPGDGPVWLNGLTTFNGGTAGVFSSPADHESTLSLPATFTDSGYELTVDADGNLSVVDLETQQLIDNYSFTTAEGVVGLRIHDDMPVSSTVPATVPEVTAAGGPIDWDSAETVAKFDVSWTEVPALYNPIVGSVVVSADGINFSVESLNELLSIDLDETAYVQNMSSDGERVYITVRTGDNQETITTLVGTPTS